MVKKMCLDGGIKCRKKKGGEEVEGNVSRFIFHSFIVMMILLYIYFNDMISPHEKYLF